MADSKSPKVDPQRIGFNALIEEAKSKGFLIHEDLINLLPNDFVDPSQMESIIDRLNEMGIKVFEFPPDVDSMLLEESEQSDDEINEDAAEVLATETRTTDPVRMYMREMGSVELLTREGEIVIAKRIEEGIRQVMSAFIQYPDMIEQFLQAHDNLVASEGRLSEIIIGFYDESESTNDAPKPPTPEPKKAAAKLDDDEDEDSGGESSGGEEDEFGEGGPDPILTQAHMTELRALLSKYVKSIKRYGKKHASTIKLSIKQFSLQTEKLRELLNEARLQERQIMGYCVIKARTPRKHFIASFPKNETNPDWLEQFKKENPEHATKLDKFSKEIQRAQKKLVLIEEQSKLSIAEIKEVNRRVAIGEAKSRRAKKEMIEANLRLVI